MNPNVPQLLVKIRERNRMLGLIREEYLVPLIMYFNDRGVVKSRSVWQKAAKSRTNVRQKKTGHGAAIKLVC